MRDIPYRKSLQKAIGYQHYRENPKAKYANAARKKFGDHWIFPFAIILTDIYGNIYESAANYKRRNSQRDVENLEQETINLNRSLARWTFALAVFSILTFFVSLGTLYVLSGQLSEMRSGGTDTHNLAEAAKSQAVAAREAIILSQRAWVGPTLAVAEAKPVANVEFKIDINYLNTGKEPAFDFYHHENYFIAGSDGIDASNIYKNVTDCQTIDLIPGSQIVYPSSGFGGGGQSHVRIKKDDISVDIVDGKKTIYVFGCMAYRTYSKTRYSAYCYAYNAKLSTQSLNFCTGGSYAD